MPVEIFTYLIIILAQIFQRKYGITTHRFTYNYKGMCSIPDFALTIHIRENKMQQTFNLTYSFLHFLAWLIAFVLITRAT